MDIAQDAPDTVILAADEASLYLQASLMRVWAPKGQTPVVRVAANRDNTHFYGALNLATGQEVMLRSAIMNAEVSALFLTQVLWLTRTNRSYCSGIALPGIRDRPFVRFLRPILCWKSCGFHRAALS